MALGAYIMGAEDDDLIIHESRALIFFLSIPFMCKQTKLKILRTVHSHEGNIKCTLPKAFPSFL